MDGATIQQNMLSEYIEFKNMLTTHVLRYPLMELRDIYKLIYQASMGGEHAISDIDAARAGMISEISNLEHETVEHTIAERQYESISPDGRVFRIHLGPFRESDSDLHAINESFIQTAKSFESSTANLRRHWFYSEQMAASGRLPFEPFQLRRFFAAQEDRHFPAVHHSNRYRSAYWPAYRIVAREFLPGFIAIDAASSPDK